MGGWHKNEAGEEVEMLDKTSRTYLTNMAMAQQAKDFERIYHELPGITMQAKGDGLIPAIIQQRKQMGLPS